MAWTESIEKAAYTGPNGERMEFNYEEGMERSTPLKTAEHTFPDVDGAEIQSLGTGGKKFPITAIFNGADCMADADKFEALLCRRGYGILEHPIYGKHTVVPTGEISRNDELVSKLNQSVVKVTFSETLSNRTFPKSKVSALDSLNAAAEAYEEAATSTFENLIETGNVDNEIQLQAVLKSQSDSFFKGTARITDSVGDAKEKSSILQKLNNCKANIDGWVRQIDQIAGNADNIAAVFIQTARLISRAPMAAVFKITGYANTIKDILNNVKKEAAGLVDIKNQYAATSLAVGVLINSLGFGVAETAAEVSSSNVSSKVSEGGFESRSSVLEAADQIAELFDEYKEYMDSQVAKEAFVDTGEGYEALLETVVCATEVLHSVAFELPVTRIVKLGRDRQLIELLCELYGAEGFDRVDQFITDNKLTADEIVLLPMGREVRYYV